MIILLFVLLLIVLFKESAEIGRALSCRRLLVGTVVGPTVSIAEGAIVGDVIGTSDSITE